MRKMEILQEKSYAGLVVFFSSWKCDVMSCFISRCAFFYVVYLTGLFISGVKMKQLKLVEK